MRRHALVPESFVSFRVLSCEFYKIFKNIFFCWTPQVVASVTNCLPSSNWVPNRHQDISFIKKIDVAYVNTFAPH